MRQVVHKTGDQDKVHQEVVVDHKVNRMEEVEVPGDAYLVEDENVVAVRMDRGHILDGEDMGNGIHEDQEGTLEVQDREQWEAVEGLLCNAKYQQRASMKAFVIGHHGWSLAAVKFAVVVQDNHVQKVEVDIQDNHEVHLDSLEPEKTCEQIQDN